MHGKKGINSTSPLSPCTTLPAQVLLNKSVNILRSSDLDILKGYNPKIRTRRSFFPSSHTINNHILAYHWILVHIINISTLKEQIASCSEGIFAAERKARKTTSGSISRVDLSQKGCWAKDHILKVTWNNLSSTKCCLWKLPHHQIGYWFLKHWLFGQCLWKPESN